MNNHDPLVNPPWWALVLTFASFLPLLVMIRKRGGYDIAQIFKYDLLARFGGLCLIGFGSGLFFVANYHPLLRVLRKDAHIQYMYGISFLTTLAVCLGLLMFVAGKHSRYYISHPHLPELPNSRVKLFTMLGICTLGIAAELACYGFFRSHGYR